MDGTGAQPVEGGREAEGRDADLHGVRRELRAMEERFRSIIHKTADGMVVVDRDGRILFANKAAERLFGRSADELRGSPFGHTVVVGETTEIDLVRDGDPLVVEIRVMDTEWEGEPARIVSLRDVTDRKQAEARARQLIREQAARAEAEEAARRAEFLGEASRRLSASLAVDQTLRSTVSLIVEEIGDLCALDLADGEEVRRFAAVRPDSDREDLVREVEAHPASFGEDTASGRVLREKEPRLVRSPAGAADHDLGPAVDPSAVMLVPLDSGHECMGVLTVAATREETELTERQLHLAMEVARRAALAIENARLYRDAQAANRAKANFLSVMSHELRTPLSAILGYADLMAQGVAGEVTAQQEDYLGRIRSASNHLLQIIEEILGFASTEAGEEKVELESMTLGELMQAVRAVAEPLGEDSDNELSIQVDDADARVRTDPRKVRQVLLNLVSNALKFTEGGSVRVLARTEGDELVFTVSDTGPGIPEDAQEAIFERFWQAEDASTRRAGGTGLGLTVARSFARLLGGGIGVESEPGEGSIFTLRIPARPRA